MRLYLINIYYIASHFIKAKEMFVVMFIIF